MTKQDFLKLGGKEWVKEDRERIYINAEIFNNLRKISFSDRNNKFFFDCKTNALMRSYKSKLPKIVEQY